MVCRAHVINSEEEKEKNENEQKSVTATQEGNVTNELRVYGVVRHKYVFTLRPKPVVTHRDKKRKL